VPPDAGIYYAEIKHQCRVKGVSLDENDFWIAATAITFGAVLVTRDDDFSRISGINAENWAT
jgi:tRNA(fMet)-specific endonuclease VapC